MTVHTGPENSCSPTDLSTTLPPPEGSGGPDHAAEATPIAQLSDDELRGGEFSTDVLIIGAGFSGLAAAAKIAHHTRRSYIVLEQGDDVGGTWRENTYPGCACDIPAPLYSFSFAQNPDWRQLFATQPDIHDYLRRISRRLGITTNVRFNTTVIAADWDDLASRWHVHTADGATFTARFLVNAVGVLHHPAIPALPGIEDFTGPVFHSATWNHDVNLAGKKVAVIGTGASAIQFVPAIADKVAGLTVFQRTAPWILPKFDRSFSEHERQRMRHSKIAMWKRRARLFWVHEQRAKGFLGDTVAMEPTRRMAVKHLQHQVSDPALRAKLTPEYAIGCKRLLISSDYYPALSKPHVGLVTDPLAAVHADHLTTVTGQRINADVLIYGTGFDAQNALTHIPIRGRDGILLDAAWPTGPQAYLGTTVHGFPNMFLMCGPNTGLGHNSQIFMIEAQANYLARCIRLAGKAGVLDVTRQAQNRYNQDLQDGMAATVWQAGGCRSWYQDPDTGRNTLLWPKPVLPFWLRTRWVRRSDYHHDRPPRWCAR
jgi:cation diffusion facilitator CzcD-associated flavoprotein CzcO